MPLAHTREINNNDIYGVSDDEIGPCFVTNMALIMDQGWQS